MVISNEDKKVLLERLQKARETKAVKAAAKKKEASVNEAPPVAPPAPEPVVEPQSVAVPVVEPQSVVVPEVPDLVAASKKKPKKVSLPDSDSDEEAVLPPKKKNAKKESAYMKIKIYREPKNPAALQDLLSAVQEEEEEQVAPPPPVAQPPASGSIDRSRKFDIRNATPKEVRTLPSPQELMRRAALEFFG